MFAIIGLGNPGKKYENTRHNAGFLAIDALAAKYGISMAEKKHKAVCGSGYIEGVKVVLVKPETYMNLSGESVRAVLDFYKLDPEEDMLIMYDDISLAPGNLRVRKKGSAGGHNGIKSIIAHAGTQNFMRIKIGVGEKPSGWDLADYVLGHFSEEDQVNLKEVMPSVMSAAVLIAQGDVDKAMNDFNAKKQGQNVRTFVEPLESLSGFSDLL